VIAVDGIVAYATLQHRVATKHYHPFQQRAAWSARLRLLLAVSPGAVSALAFATQPGNAQRRFQAFGNAAGGERARMRLENNSSSGLPASLPVNISLTAGPAALYRAQRRWTLAQDSGDGTVTFSVFGN
jgi:hypothetical protein